MQTIHESATETAANIIDFASKLAEKKTKKFDESLTVMRNLHKHQRKTESIRDLPFFDAY